MAPRNNKETAVKTIKVEQVEKVTLQQSKVVDASNVSKKTKAVKAKVETAVVSTPVDATAVPVVTESRATKTRPHNLSETSLDATGVGIGPAKSKNVLISEAFNPVEYKARAALRAAENRPVRAKPTTEVPDPPMPTQGPQVPIDQLDEETRAVVHAAEAAHRASLLAEYQHDVVKAYPKERRDAYEVARKAARDSPTFRLVDFNKSFDAKFYAAFEKYYAENDSYSLTRMVTGRTRPNGTPSDTQVLRYNTWTRAMALINKNCIRLSSGVRDVLASYLDSIVMQYAHNAIVNAVADGKPNIQLNHALAVSDGFNARVSLHPFVQTLPAHATASNWLSEYNAYLVSRKEKSTDVPLPRVPTYNSLHDGRENFEGYVVDICRSVRMRLAVADPERADTYHSIKVSDNFKKFCSDVVYETILRVGAHLKEVVSLKEVKTVNDSLMYHTLRQISNVCGVPWEPIRSEMAARLTKYAAYLASRKSASDSSDEDTAVSYEE